MCTAAISGGQLLNALKHQKEHEARELENAKSERWRNVEIHLVLQKKPTNLITFYEPLLPNASTRRLVSPHFNTSC